MDHPAYDIPDGYLIRYNSLLDPHLSGYFSSNRMRRHLKRSGLITSNGEVISEQTYRLNIARSENKKPNLALNQSAVHRELEREQTRQVEMKRKLEELAKRELVRKVKEDEEKFINSSGDQSTKRSKSSSDSRQSNTADWTLPRSKSNLQKSNSRNDARLSGGSVPSSGGTAEQRTPRSPDNKRSRYNEVNQRSTINGSRSPESRALWDYAMLHRSIDSWVSPYNLPKLVDSPSSPPQTANRSPRQSSPSKRNIYRVQPTDRYGKPTKRKAKDQPNGSASDKDSGRCHVTLKYLSSSLALPYFEDDVMIEQQHCGGNTRIVYRGRIYPETEFTFPSYRQEDYPFGLTLYVNGSKYIRVSTCCEYKYPSDTRLGGSMGLFKLVSVSGGSPCPRCGKDEEQKSEKSRKTNADKQTSTERKQNEDRNRNGTLPPIETDRKQRKKQEKRKQEKTKRKEEEVPLKQVNENEGKVRAKEKKVMKTEADATKKPKSERVTETGEKKEVTRKTEKPVKKAHKFENKSEVKKPAEKSLIKDVVKKEKQEDREDESAALYEDDFDSSSEEEKPRLEEKSKETLPKIVSNKKQAEKTQKN